ncbi:PTS system mannose/fructose/sorbose family transporter subunit IID, partial [Gemmatimonadota bacterium]
MRSAGIGAHLSTFLRSFVIQGSWNYRTMLGGGFAFCILPVLRRLYGGDPEMFQDALRRHSEHFNAHPYLADLALGAVCRMEEEGRDPEEIGRFKTVLRGPLGSLGDALVWVGWRPAMVLASLALALAGSSPGTVVAFFLLFYNLGHLALRVWGFRVGLERGSQVGDSLRVLSLPKQAERMGGVGMFLLGGISGLTLIHAWELGGRTLLWALPVALGLW